MKFSGCINLAFIDQNLPVFTVRNMQPIQGARSWPCKIRPDTVELTAMTGAFEYAIISKVIRGTPKMGTPCIYCIEPV